MSDKRKFWHVQWSRGILVGALTLVTSILLAIVYAAYWLVRSKIALYVIGAYYTLVYNEWARGLYQAFKPEIGMHFKKQGNFLQPWSFWLSAPPEENYQMIKKLGLQMVVKGADKIPKTGGVVVMANHVTVADPAILMHICNKARGDEGSTCLMGIWNDYEIDQAHPSKLFLVNQKSMIPGGFKKISEILKEDRIFIIFPTGSLGLQRFKAGALRIALENKVPILPIKIEIQLDWWTELLRVLNPEMLNSILIGRSFTLYRTNVMRVTVGDLIPYEELQKYKDRMIETQNGKRFHPKVMEELRNKVEGIR